MKKPSHRIFDYTPRFYKPEHDDKERRKRKLGFRRQSKFKRKEKSSLLWLILFLIGVFIYLKLSGSI